MTFRTRHRRWIALLALFGLLFQQIAMAGYRCPMQDVSPACMHLGEGASGCECPKDGDRTRCEQHCAPDSLTSSDHAPSVPALAATMPSWLEQSSRDRRVSDAALGATVSVRTAAPPLIDRFCKRLI